MHPFAKAVEETGFRADLGEQVAEADYPAIKDGVYRYLPEQAEEMLERAVKLKRDWQGRADGRITVSWAPRARALRAQDIVREANRPDMKAR